MDGVRIVAGLAKGRRLAPPAGGTRPTSDRAREAMFNALTSLVDLDGASVLDLFAGTGAVGLEALSRGAARAVFVESDRGAVGVLRGNVERVGLRGADVRPLTVAAYLGSATDEPFGLVFADPPYALADDVLAAHLAVLTGGGLLTGDAVLVVERSARGGPPVWPESVYPVQQKRYGEGVLWYGRRR